MYTASEKKRENIAEYLLYMWQIEDLIRAYDLDLDRIEHEIIDKYTGLDSEGRKALYEWYESLIDMMRREEVTEKGHLQMNRNVIGHLADLNRRILEDPAPRFDSYRKEFYATLPFIVELRAKSGEDKAGEIETCFNALYGTLMLRLQKKIISSETTVAMDQISRFIAMLSHYAELDDRDELFRDDKGEEQTGL